MKGPAFSERQTIALYETTAVAEFPNDKSRAEPRLSTPAAGHYSLCVAGGSSAFSGVKQKINDEVELCWIANFEREVYEANQDE
jgi:hypothetical protein